MLLTGLSLGRGNQTARRSIWLPIDKNFERMNYGKLEFQYVYWINTSLLGIKFLLIKYAFPTGDFYACKDSVSFYISHRPR